MERIRNFGHRLQRRNLQFPRAAPRTRIPRPSLPHALRYRSDRPRLRSLGSRLRFAPPRHVRPRHPRDARRTGGRAAPSVPRARSLGNQAALLRLRGGRIPLRLRSGRAARRRKNSAETLSRGARKLSALRLGRRAHDSGRRRPLTPSGAFPFRCRYGVDRARRTRTLLEFSAANRARATSANARRAGESRADVPRGCPARAPDRRRASGNFSFERNRLHRACGARQPRAERRAHLHRDFRGARFQRSGNRAPHRRASGHPAPGTHAQRRGNARAARRSRRRPRSAQHGRHQHLLRFVGRAASGTESCPLRPRQR